VFEIVLFMDLVINHEDRAARVAEYKFDPLGFHRVTDNFCAAQEVAGGLG
jgi:hypothetical protein